VRKGNPQGIKDWGDLAEPGVQVITRNPKDLRRARVDYLAAWATAAHSGGDEARRSHSSPTSITMSPCSTPGPRNRRPRSSSAGIGDVLAGVGERWPSWRSKELGATRLSGGAVGQHLAEPPVAVVDKVSIIAARAQSPRPTSRICIRGLPGAGGQHYYRPRRAEVAAKHAGDFPTLPLFTIDDTFGGWTKTQATHFADGGVFDEIYKPGQ